MALPIRSLRGRMALFFSLLLALVLGAFFYLTTTANERIFTQQASHELESGERVFHRLLELNQRQLLQSARVLAADFGFRAALASGDRATILSALQNQGNRINAELVVMSNTEGHVLAANMQDGWGAGGYPFASLLKKAQVEGFAQGVELVGSRAYALVLVPVKAPLTIGWVTMGLQLDNDQAAELKSLSGLEVSFVAKGEGWRSIGSTMASAELAGQLGMLAYPDTPQTVMVDGRVYQSRLMPLNAEGGRPLFALLQKPLGEILTPFYRLQQFMLILALVSLLLAVIGSALLARLISSPLSLLVAAATRIRDGNYREAIPLPETRELGQLADALSHMQSAIFTREQEILALAYRDTLTGLVNRAGFVRELELQMFSELDELTIVVLDIDRFQLLNDTLGHDTGDLVIRRVAQSLQRLAFEHGAVVARLGGDEFALSLPHGRHACQDMLDAVQAVFEQQMEVGERSVDVRASLGLASYPEHAISAMDLLRCADEAMYAAKRNKSTVATYDAAKRQFREEHLSLLGDLRLAVEEGQLMLYLQPKVPLSGHGACEAEALLRWQHPLRGFVPPFDFIPYAEQTGFIRELTRWVLAQGCKEAALLRDAGMPTRVSFNLATRDLLDASLPEYVSHCMHEAGLPAELVCLEITESGVMEDPNRAMDTLFHLRELGLALAIDDYGTGYSSLAYIKQLPVSELKIDRTFVNGICDSEADATIVRSTVELAHSMGFTVVAEGVETEQIANKLRELGCDFAQGYWYAKPMPLQDYLAWVRAYESVSVR